MQFSKNKHSNSVKYLIYKEKKRQFLYLLFELVIPTRLRNAKALLVALASNFAVVAVAPLLNKMLQRACR